MSKVKHAWLSLPFLGSSKRPEQRRRPSKSASSDQPINGLNGASVERELARQTTAKDVAEENEEDVVADYNSPIHMCTPSLSLRSQCQALMHWVDRGGYYFVSTRGG